MGRFWPAGFRGLVHAAAWLPLAWIIWRLAQDNLTANPIREIQLETGRIAITLLFLSLACSPLYYLSGIEEIKQARRTLGLYAFMYAGLHFLNFTGMDYGFDVPAIVNAVGDKKFPLAGMASFLILIPLAVTSTSGWRERLGKKWKRFHRLVYAAAVLAVFHYIWAAKSQADARIPLTYAAALAALLGARIPAVRRLITNKLRT